MNYPKKRIAIAIAMIGCAAQPLIVHAEENASQLERVEVVGSNIKRAATKQATQVEVYKTEEFTKQGLTTTQEIVNSLASNQSSYVASSAVGASTGGASYANLRGLGSQYTLVLLDGRRMSNTPVSGFGGEVDLNSIPLDLIERVEVLKDGASAIYGTDAIGGVINFITKKAFQGATVSVDYSTPERSGGGTEKKASVAGGLGNLNKNGWNVQGFLSASKQSQLLATDRADIAIDRQYSLSGSTFPSNYANNNGVYNPYYQNCRAGTIQSGQKCKEITNYWIGISPEVERVQAGGKASAKLADDHELSVQYIYSKNTTDSQVAPTPLFGLVSIPSTSPYYPATDPNGNANSGDLPLYGRTVPLGPRKEEDTIVMHHVQTNLEGLLGGWDYKAGLGYSQTEVTQTLTGGYVSQSLLQNAINQGLINPFGPSPAGAWESVQLKGDLSKATMQLTTGDFKISKEILELPAGNLAVAFGAEFRHEKLDDKELPLGKEAMSSGRENSASASGNRNVNAIYTEALIPITKELEAQLAARYDTYSDFGSAFNPKIALKYVPVKQVTFRGSASTGFRAPTLYNMYQPNQVTFTQSQYYDPLLCPNGNPKAGVSSTSAACTLNQLNIQQGGNRNLKPETSTSTSFGVVVEPTKTTLVSADLWWTNIKHTISSIPEQTIMNNLDKYQDRFVANADGSLAYMKALDQNIGNTRASGLDMSGMWALPRTSIGNFTLGINSTYMIKYDYQNEENGEYIHNVGRYADNGAIFRWKYELTLGWNLGPWSSTISQSYHSGYQDMNPEGEDHKVKGDSRWNVSASYDWKKLLNATIGVRNVFNRKPAYTNQNQSFQVGYDPRYSDIYGRTFFLNLTYKM